MGSILRGRNKLFFATGLSQSTNPTCIPGRGGGGGVPYNDLYGEAPAERDTFFRLQVYERVRISLVEV